MGTQQGVRPPQDEAVDYGGELFAAFYPQLGLVCRRPRLSALEDRGFKVFAELGGSAQHPGVAEVHHRIELQQRLSMFLALSGETSSASGATSGDGYFESVRLLRKP